MNKHSIKLILTTLIFTIVALNTVHSQTWNKIGISKPTTGWASTSAITVNKYGIVYVSFLNINDQASVMKYDGASWSAVGAPYISAGMISNCGEPTPIATDTAGMPYIAYPDTNGKATVMKYNGTNWLPVGSPCIPNSSGGEITLAIDGNSTPYIGFQDTNGKATVMKYNGSTWVNVGSPGFSTGFSFLPALAIAPDGTPYLGYCDNPNSNELTVMKFDGTSWVTVGIPDFTGSALYPSMAIDKYGTPYIAFDDESSVTGSASVMKFNGANWVYVGREGFSTGGAEFTTMAIDTFGTPYISFSDFSTANDQETVMKFNGSSWEIVGTAGFSAGTVFYAPIAISPSGTLYVSYADTSTNVSNIDVMQFVSTASVNNRSIHKVVSISVYPDPSQGMFSLKLSSAVNEEALVTITDITGRQVKDLKVLTNLETQVQLGVPPGAYFLAAIVNNEKTAVKIVVE